jgi:hypothetical protein
MPFVRVGTENSAEIDIHYRDQGAGRPIVLIHTYTLVVHGTADRILPFESDRRPASRRADDRRPHVGRDRRRTAQHWLDAPGRGQRTARTASGLLKGAGDAEIWTTLASSWIRSRSQTVRPARIAATPADSANAGS